MKNKLIQIAMLFLMGNNALAQKGSFNTTFVFDASNRDVSCFVPLTYDSTLSYRLMICLHGAGDNSNNYRNALINSFSWQNTFPNTIFVCPDGGADKNKDFYQPTGDERVIAAVLDFAVKKFSIDTNQIILQGFSLGGRSALKYGLDNPDKFRGLLLNTPAIQGLADLDNKPGASLQFNYPNAEKIPISVTVGETDYAYYYTIQKLIGTLKRNNAPLLYQAVPNLGHSIPGNTVTSKSNSFFNHQNIPAFEADLFELESDLHACATTVQSNVLVRNDGDSILSSFKISVSNGVVSKSQDWKGSLLPNHYVKIPVVLDLNKGGKHTLTYRVSAVNSGKPEADTTNNRMGQAIEVLDKKELTSLNEGFENAEPAWTIQESGSIFGWYSDPDVKKTGSFSFGIFNTILLFNTLGYKESFVSPFIDISALSHKDLTFDLAFNYHKYTPPYFVKDTYFSDTLEVMISTDCGVTFQSLYRKGGRELATAADPILNPLSIPAALFTPKNDQWRKDGIDLSQYATVKNALIKFVCISGMGGSLNIDNINAGSHLLSVAKQPATEWVKMFPNPAGKTVSLELALPQKAEIRIFDPSGRLVLSQTSDYQGMNPVSVEELPRGLYTVEILSEDLQWHKKLLLE